MSSLQAMLLNPLKSKLNHALILIAGALIGHSNGVRETRNYYTKVKKGTLYCKLSHLGNHRIAIKPELDKWVNNGKRVCFAELQRIILDFRKRLQFNHALEVSEWMYARGLFKLTPTEHAVHLDLIGRVHGFLSAEDYFYSLQDVEKTNKTCGALLNCYVRQRQVDKALALFEKMKEMGFACTTLTYNDIMRLYTNFGQYDKVPDVLTEMKKKKVLPDSYSYRLCINSYVGRSDMETVENCLIEAETQPHMAVDWNTYAAAANFFIRENSIDKAVYALKKAEVRLDDKDNSGYSFLISLYGKLGKKLGNKDEILRLWELEKNASKKCINREFITVLESLVKIDALEEAEKVLKEWDSSDNVYDFRVPNIVILGYLNLGLAEKGEAILNELLEKGRPCHPNTWSILAGMYHAKGEMRKALSCMKVGLSFYVPNEGWRPYNQVINSLLSWVGDHGSLDEAESFVDLLRNVDPVNRPLYHTLMKAYIRHGKSIDGLWRK